MKHDTERFFEDLTPPPGGLNALRVRIERERTRRLRFRVATATAVTLIALFVGVFVMRPVSLPYGSESPVDLISGAASDPGVISLGLAPLPSEPITVPSSERHRMAAQRVSTADPTVVFYLIGTTN